MIPKSGSRFSEKIMPSQFVRVCWGGVMTDPFAPRGKAPNDLEMLIQVEQWMTAIREISRDERAEMDSASDRLEHLLAPANE
jgi:hypothetical protein